MKTNKIVIRCSQCDKIAACLLDSKIYTICSISDGDKSNLSYGCFIDLRSAENYDDFNKQVCEQIKKFNLDFSPLDSFIQIEKENQPKRVAKAFATAEKIIQNN